MTHKRNQVRKDGWFIERLPQGIASVMQCENRAYANDEDGDPSIDGGRHGQSAARVALCTPYS